MKSRFIAVLACTLALAVGGTVYAFSADNPPPAPIVVAQATPAPIGDAFTPDQQAAINTMIADYIAANPQFVREYILANPEVITDAVAILEQRRVADEAARQLAAIDQYRDLLLNSPRQAVIGNPDGDVTLVEFFDYNCSYCKRALADMNRLVAEDPGLRIVLKEFPVLGVGSTEAAQVAAGVILIAPEQYDAFHQLLLGSATPASGELALAAAEQVGIDRAALVASLANPEIAATIEEGYTIAGALGLTGTPSYVIGDQVVVGAVGYDTLRGMIDSMRECGRAAC